MKALARRAMSVPVVTVRSGASLKSAQALMKKHKIRHLPVLDEKGSVVGILSDRDLNRALRSTISLDDAGTGTYMESAELDPTALVRQYMSWPVKSVTIDDDLRLVARKMMTDKVSALLVRNGKRIVGIVTTDDLLRVLFEILPLIGPNQASWSLASLIEQSLEGLGNSSSNPDRKTRR